MAFHDGGRDEAIARMALGDNLPDALVPERGEEVLRFLRDLSLDLFPVQTIATTGPLAEA